MLTKTPDSELRDESQVRLFLLIFPPHLFLARDGERETQRTFERPSSSPAVIASNSGGGCVNQFSLPQSHQPRHPTSQSGPNPRILPESTGPGLQVYVLWTEVVIGRLACVGSVQCSQRKSLIKRNAEGRQKAIHRQILPGQGYVHACTTMGAPLFALSGCPCRPEHILKYQVLNTACGRE